MTQPRFGLVLGFPRSGGTVLRRILDHHPEISCPLESWLTTASAQFLADMPSHSVPLGVRTGVGLMQPYLTRFLAPVEALAQAWVDTTEAMLDFARGRDDAMIYRFEDLLTNPPNTLTPIYSILGVAAQTMDQINAAVAAPARPGLGDWKTYGETSLNTQPIGRWQKTIPRRVAGALMARLAPVMGKVGYDPVPVLRLPSRADAIKQFSVAARMAARADGRV